MDDRDIGRSPEPPDEHGELKYFEISEELLDAYLWNVISVYLKINQHFKTPLQAREEAVKQIMKAIDYGQPYTHK